jgi:mRNA interferase MazF
VKRGSIYTARFEPVEGSEQGGIRPVVVMTRDSVNVTRRQALVVPLTTMKEGRRLLPYHVVIRAPDGGLAADSVALADQLRALSEGRFGRNWGALSPEILRRVEEAILIVLGIDWALPLTR